MARRKEWGLTYGALIGLAAMAGLALCPSASGQTSPVPMKIRAVSDNVRVSPVTGKILVEGKNHIHADYPRGSYQERNLVWDSAIPHENHLPGDIRNGSMRNMPFEQEMDYYQPAQQHRFLPLVYAYTPVLSIQGTGASLDWTAYDRRLSPYLDGSAFTRKHGYWGPG